MSARLIGCLRRTDKQRNLPLVCPVSFVQPKRGVYLAHRLIRVAAGHDQGDVALAAALGDSDDIDGSVAQRAEDAR